jgi:hypothetical protein
MDCFDVATLRPEHQNAMGNATPYMYSKLRLRRWVTTWVNSKTRVFKPRLLLVKD